MHYIVRKIVFGGKPVQVVLQAVNGPCPLIAICNVLLLRRAIVFPPQVEIVTLEDIRVRLEAFLKAEVEQAVNKDVAANNDVAVANRLEAHEQALKAIPRLERGLDVNVVFQGSSCFEFTPELSVFDLIKCRLYHCWTYDPQDRQLADALGSISYNRAIDLVSSEPRSEAEAKRRALIQQFLRDTASQITVHGVSKLQEITQEGEIFVLFRNNHFSTMVKRKGELFTLITNYELIRPTPKICWAKPSPGTFGDGDLLFVDDNFKVLSEPEMRKANSHHSLDSRGGHRNSCRLM